jgi:hypothetical protein
MNANLIFNFCLHASKSGISQNKFVKKSLCRAGKFLFTGTAPETLKSHWKTQSCSGFFLNLSMYGFSTRLLRVVTTADRSGVAAMHFIPRFLNPAFFGIQFLIVKAGSVFVWISHFREL